MLLAGLSAGYRQKTTKGIQFQMTTKKWPLLMVAGGAILAGFVKHSASARRRPPMTVAPSIDLFKYAGTWYEIARLPNRFEKQCAGDTTATYTVRPDGKIGVLNQCRRPDGRVASVRGTARPASPAGPNTKLKVSFSWPFAGDYWILDVDRDYRWALIGEPGRKYLWILSRQPRLAQPVLDGLLDRARQEGYQVDNLLSTPQPATA
jgi:apolipoprotein D and lipocalin family protein